MSDRETLLSMGFEPARVDWALRATAGKGLQPAMDHILANNDNPVPADGGANASASKPMASGGDDEYDEEDQAAIMATIAKSGQAAGEAMAQQAGEAKSIKCLQCGKVLKSTAFASFHAEKSGHDQFEESTEEVKPLTEEEKKEKLEELRKRLAEKRAAQAKEDAEAAKANEVIRRKGGKDLTQIKEDLKKKEAAKEAEKKRQEKIEDAKAKARVKAEIEADKRERARKAAEEKAVRAGIPAPSAGLAPSPSPSPLAALRGAAGSSQASTARLQVRTGSGNLTTQFPAESRLSEVEAWVKGETGAVGEIKFSMTFPRKTFTAEEMSKTLRELGLVPSSVLVVSQ